MACKEEVILFHFLEPGIKRSQRCHCLLNKYGISDTCCLVISGTEPYSHWQFQIEHISILVPGIVIELEVMGPGVEDEGTILVEGSKETGAARTA